MHQNFSDWYRPVTFGHDRETINLRWQGVEATIQGLEFPIAMDLVLLAFGRPALSVKEIEKFRQYFKDVDPTFSTSGNDLEVQTLAGCVLGILCIDKHDWGEVPFAIVTASACKKRVPIVEFDLVGMASERIRLEGIQARKRQTMSMLEIDSYKQTLDQAIAPFLNNQGIPHAVEALKQMNVVLEKSFASLQENIKKEINQLQEVLTIQDEELQMLWWMTGGWSEMWKSTFHNLDNKARPILLAKEASEMTELFSEPPSLKAVFYRVGIDESTELNIPDSVNACGLEHLKTLSPQSPPCSILFPMHFAISRAIETGADNTWIPGWSKVSGIDEKAKVMPIELALQFYREIKLMTQFFEASDE